MKIILALSLICALTGTAALAETTNGTWNATTERGTLQLEMSWHSAKGDHNSNHSSNIDAQALGIANAIASSGEHVTFKLQREAGDYSFEGWAGKGEGAGTYTFTPNDTFFAALRARGYDVNSMDYEIAFANLDITTSYVDQMEALGYKGDVNHLVAMKALDITPQYVRDLQSAGVTDLSASQIIALRALRVDAEYIGEIAGAGFPRLSAGQYVTLRAMRVDAAYIRYLRGHGFKNLTVNQVVTMKAERI